MQAKLAAWRESVGAKSTPPNPNYDPAKAKERTMYNYQVVWNPADPIIND